jgi:hypothetical protein
MARFGVGFLKALYAHGWDLACFVLDYSASLYTAKINTPQSTTKLKSKYMIQFRKTVDCNG